MSESAQPLSLNDLIVVKNMIELACQRGTWQAGEMRTVGEIYDKLSAFLDYIVQQAEQAPQTTQGETNA
jgi:hypothetical protein